MPLPRLLTTEEIIDRIQAARDHLKTAASAPRASDARLIAKEALDSLSALQQDIVNALVRYRAGVQMRS